MQVVRPTPELLDEAIALLQASDVAAYGDSDWTEGELREEWEGLDLERDAWLVRLDGRLAAVAHLLERRQGRFIGDAYVHPELTGRGVGTEVLDVRSGFRMVIDRSGADVEADWPDGIELRPLDVERDGRRVHAAVEEAFAAEWGFVNCPYDAWCRRTFELPRFDPSLVPVAWDAAADEIAGVSLNFPKRMGDWGWIGAIGVRPAWRRRGVGLALLRESFRRFRDAGETVVALGVDAENPTGAVLLYERAGMRVLWRADVWQKELRGV